jgi:hypothetical protein
VSLALGLATALASAIALGWGWVAQHAAAGELPRLTLRRPLRSLAVLAHHRGWLRGFAVGIVGWGLYIGALRLAPLSLVQAVSAGAIGVVALLARRHGERAGAHRRAIGLALGGLVLLALSLVGGADPGGRPGVLALAAWLAVSGAVAAGATLAGGRLAPGAGLGIAAGTLYAAGDVATKGATLGGGWLVLVPVVLAAHGTAFALLQLAFQRGRALATAGLASLLTSALPIAAGLAVYGEGVPRGAPGALRVTAFGAVVLGAALLAQGLGDAAGDERPRPVLAATAEG